MPDCKALPPPHPPPAATCFWPSQTDYRLFLYFAFPSRNFFFLSLFSRRHYFFSNIRFTSFSFWNSSLSVGQLFLKFDLPCRTKPLILNSALPSDGIISVLWRHPPSASVMLKNNNLKVISRIVETSDAC